MKAKSLLNVKIVLSIILLVCFFLPLSRCQIITIQEDTAKQTEISPEQTSSIEARDNAIQTGETVKYDYRIPYKDFDVMDLESWQILLPFFFALPFILLESKIVKFSKIIPVMLLDAFIAFYSVNLVGFIIFVGEPLIFGYIALIAIILYSLIVTIQFVLIVIDAIKQKRSQSLLMDSS